MSGMIRSKRTCFSKCNTASGSFLFVEIDVSEFGKREEQTSLKYCEARVDEADA
jgi:hypothetical protein